MQIYSAPLEQLAIVSETAFDEGDDEPPDSCAIPAPHQLPPISSPIFLSPRPTLTAKQRKRQPAASFRKQYYPGVSAKQWNDWHWQVANRVRSYSQLSSMLRLSEDEKAAFARADQGLPLAITPYYMSLINPNDPTQPIRRTVTPSIHESLRSSGEADDPLGETHQSPVSGLVHRYPDRVLFLLTDFCSTYCRYCTRSRVVGHNAIQPSRARLEQALAYIRAHESIRDVLLSGGDPLLLADEQLDWVLSQLRLIPHVEIIRIGTKTPAVLPQRITPKLVKMLRRHHPLMMSLHFAHPDECAPETSKACARLADGGIPLGSQTVLLQGVNDDVETMKKLMHALLKMRVRPYYLYQCDPISGSAHFRTPVAKGLEIIAGLRGYTSGYAIPTYVIDAPGGGGKIPLMPQALLGADQDGLVMKNYENKVYRYPDLSMNHTCYPTDK